MIIADLVKITNKINNKTKDEEGNRLIRQKVIQEWIDKINKNIKFVLENNFFDDYIDYKKNIEIYSSEIECEEFSNYTGLFFIALLDLYKNKDLKRWIKYKLDNKIDTEDLLNYNYSRKQVYFKEIFYFDYEEYKNKSIVEPEETLLLNEWIKENEYKLLNCMECVRITIFIISQLNSKVVEIENRKIYNNFSKYLKKLTYLSSNKQNEFLNKHGNTISKLNDLIYEFITVLRNELRTSILNDDIEKLYNLVPEIVEYKFQQKLDIKEIKKIDLEMINQIEVAFSNEYEYSLLKLKEEVSITKEILASFEDNKLEELRKYLKNKDYKNAIKHIKSLKSEYNCNLQEHEEKNREKEKDLLEIFKFKNKEKLIEVIRKKDNYKRIYEKDIQVCKKIEDIMVSGGTNDVMKNNLRFGILS